MENTRAPPGDPSLGILSSEPSWRVELNVIGGFDLRLDGESVPVPKRVQRLLVFLALHDRPLARNYVAESLWLDTSERQARANLRSALWRLGQLGAPIVAVTGGRLALHPWVAVDLRRSRDLGHQLVSGGDNLHMADLDDALLSQDLLPDWYEDWLLEERERYRQLRLHALEVLCEQLTNLKRFQQGIQAGLAAVAGEPLRESAQRVLVTAYLAEGNSFEALKQYRRYRTLLQTELGQEPSPDLTCLLTQESTNR